MKSSLLIAFILLLFFIIICGCSSPNTTNSNPTSNTLADILPRDQYVVIYEEYYNNSTLIGNTPDIPGHPWPVPVPYYPFDYNNSTGFDINVRLIAVDSINDSFKILLGKSAYYENANSYGEEGVFPTCVYSLPYIPEDGFTIMNISRNGTVYATFNNTSITLAPDEKWTSPITTGTIMGSYHLDDMEHGAVTYGNGTVIYVPWPEQYNTTFRVTNMGVYNKSLWNSSYAPISLK